MLMVRREFLSDFEHLLTEEGRQKEAKRRWIGIEKLEAALDTAEHGHGPNPVVAIETEDRDGKLHYEEFPHPDWERANRNDDDVVDWAEELSDRVLKKLAEEGDFLSRSMATTRKSNGRRFMPGASLTPVSNRSSTSSIGIAMERSPRRNTRPLRIS